MLGKIGTSVVIAVSLFLGAVRLPAVPCILSNAPVEKKCTMGCCKYKSCCETSDKRTGPPLQPLAKAGSAHQNIATFASTVPVAVFDHSATELFVFSSAECGTHSPPPLALICIRLI
jgi:hypothetical protein